MKGINRTCFFSIVYRVRSPAATSGWSLPAQGEKAYRICRTSRKIVSQHLPLCHLITTQRFIFLLSSSVSMLWGIYSILHVFYLRNFIVAFPRDGLGFNCQTGGLACLLLSGLYKKSIMPTAVPYACSSYFKSQ